MQRDRARWRRRGALCREPIKYDKHNMRNFEVEKNQIQPVSHVDGNFSKLNYTAGAEMSFQKEAMHIYTHVLYGVSVIKEATSKAGYCRRSSAAVSSAPLGPWSLCRQDGKCTVSPPATCRPQGIKPSTEMFAVPCWNLWTSFFLQYHKRFNCI